MSETLLEKSWKTVNVKSQYNQSSAMGMNEPIEKSYSWYRRIIENTGKRDMKLERYDIMDNDSVEISRALDILAEDVSSCNADGEDQFVIDYDDEDKMKKTTIKLMEQMKNQWQERTGLYKSFYNHARDTLKYGSKFFLKRKDGSLKELVQSRVVGYVIDQNDDTKVSHYLYDDARNFKNKEGDDIGHQKAQTGAKSNYVAIPVEDMLVLKIGDGPFGESVLHRVFSLWKKLQLLEDSVIIYRVVRAPERRVYYIDTGDLPPQKAESYVNQIRQKMKQKQVSKNNDISTEFDPHSAGEDFFIPQSGDGRGSKIESLPGGTQTGELDDVRYFAKKLAAMMRVPSSMMDIHQDDRDKPQHSDMRVGQLYQEEMRYLGFIKRMQNQVAECLYNHFKEYCRERDINFPHELIFEINTPHNYAIYKDNELNQQLLNVYNSADNIMHMSKRFTLEKYLHLDPEEIRQNERMVLMEKGLSEDKIKDIPEEHVYNIVYGDGSKGSEYGLETEEGGGFGGRRF